MVKREFRVGDRVTCNVHGLGVVKLVAGDYDDNSVGVIFDNSQQYIYMKDGKYMSGSKRTLFIIPKKKPTTQEVKNKYKELLDSVEEVEFVAGENNYCVIPTEHDGKNVFTFRKTEYVSFNHLNFKYISKKDADMIVKKMQEFVKTDL